MSDQPTSPREQPLNCDRDASRWAREFNDVLEKRYKLRVDEGWLLGWFATAFMCGEDTYRWRKEALQSEIAQTNAAAQVQSAPKAQANEKEETVRHATGPVAAAPQVEKSDTPRTDSGPWPRPQYAQEIVFEGCGCLAISPEDYTALYESHAQLERELNAARSATGALEQELRNIAEAKRFDRTMFGSDTEFADWAQSRCRFTLRATDSSAHSASSGPDQTDMNKG